MVTSDDSIGHNKLVWEKPGLAQIDSYRIYKKDFTDQFQAIATLDDAAFSTYIDQNSDPRQKSYKYRLAAIDSCGYETLLSDTHVTIHLTINEGQNDNWNLIWNSYEGLNFNTYRILRRSDSTSPWQAIDSIGASNTSYTDFNPPSSQTIDYQIEIKHPTGCTPTQKKGTPYARIRSNVATTSTTGLQESDLWQRIRAQVTPNPFQQRFQLKYHLPEQAQVKVELRDITGQHIQNVVEQEQPPGRHTLSLAPNLSSGFYILSIEVNGTVDHKKIIKLH
jgi:hypothetical protein